jgi:hypothetical protein
MVTEGRYRRSGPICESCFRNGGLMLTVPPARVYTESFMLLPRVADYTIDSARQAQCVAGGVGLFSQRVQCEITRRTHGVHETAKQ